MPEPVALSEYEAIAVSGSDASANTGMAEDKARRARLVGAVGIISIVALCCVAAIGGGKAEMGGQLALELKRLLIGGHGDKKIVNQGLYIGTDKDKKVKYFELDTDPSLGAQGGSWSYTVGAANGPDAWAAVSPDNALCKNGQMQNPVNIMRAEVKQRLDTLPPLRWLGYEAEPFIEEGMEARAFFDGHSICIGGPFNGKLQAPHSVVKGFSRYLGDLPLDKVEVKNYTVREMRFHTPAEHQIDGETFPFEMQIVHECSPTTDPPCPIIKTMIASFLFREANTGWLETSPEFLSNLLDDLRLIEGSWSQYVASMAFDFGKVKSTRFVYNPSPSPSPSRFQGL
jgi:hypothetical protein